MRTTLEAHTAALKRYSKSAKREAKVQYLSDVSTKATDEGGAARKLRKLMATSRDVKRTRDTGFNKHVRAGSKQTRPLMRTSVLRMATTYRNKG